MQFIPKTSSEVFQELQCNRFLKLITNASQHNIAYNLTKHSEQISQMIN